MERRRTASLVALLAVAAFADYRALDDAPGASEESAVAERPAPVRTTAGELVVPLRSEPAPPRAAADATAVPRGAARPSAVAVPQREVAVPERRARKARAERPEPHPLAVAVSVAPPTEPAPVVNVVSPPLDTRQSPPKEPVKRGRRQAILDVIVNGAPKGEHVIVLRRGDVLVTRRSLRKMGLSALEGRARPVGRRRLSLDSLAPAVSYRVDEAGLRLELIADAALLPGTELDLGRSRRPEGIVHGRSPSAYLNYGARLVDARSYDGFTEVGISAAGAQLYGAATWRSGDVPVRGLTQLTIDDRRRLRRYLVGDAWVPPGTLGGGAFVGGVGIASRFDLDPYFITTPGFGVDGVAMMPSTMEVYVNGELVRTERLPAGPYRIGNLPLTTGAGDTRVVVRDALGQVHTLASNYYLPGAQLAPGVSEYTYAIGARRRQLGLESWDYGAPAALGRHRLGISRLVTVGGRVDAAADLASAGVAASLATTLGHVELALGGSFEDGEAGAAAGAAYAYVGRRGSLGAYVRGRTDRYAAIDLGAGDDRLLLEAGGSVGVPLSRTVSLSANAFTGRLRDQGSIERVSVSSHVRLARGLQLSLTASRAAHAGGGPEMAAFALLTKALGRRTSGSVTTQTSEDGERATVAVQRSMPAHSGVGFQARGSVGGPAHGNLLVEGQGQHGRISAAVDARPDAVHSTLSVAGGLVAIGGRVFATRPVQRSFALVRVPGVEGVEGYVDNRSAGRTDSRGDLVIVDLIPHYANRISINARDVPADRDVPDGERLIAPPERGGAVVVFSAETLRVVRGRVVIANGDASYGEIQATGDQRRAPAPLGAGGAFELDGVPSGRQRFIVEHRGGRCRLDLDVPNSERPFVNLGGVPCTALREEAVR